VEALHVGADHGAGRELDDADEAVFEPRDLVGVERVLEYCA
jgi:hypothetical protein